MQANQSAIREQVVQVHIVNMFERIRNRENCFSSFIRHIIGAKSYQNCVFVSGFTPKFRVLWPFPHQNSSSIYLVKGKPHKSSVICESLRCLYTVQNLSRFWHQTAKREATPKSDLQSDVRFQNGSGAKFRLDSVHCGKIIDQRNGSARMLVVVQWLVIQSQGLSYYIIALHSNSSS